MQTFKPSWLLRFLVALFLLLPSVILFGVAIWNPGARTVTLAFAVPLGAIGVGLWIPLGRSQLTIDDKTMKQRRAFGGETALRFDEVSEYRYQCVTVNGVDQLSLELRAPDGRKIKIGPHWRDVFELIQLLLERTEPLLRSPSFGPVSIEGDGDGDALVYKDKRVPFGEIAGVTLDGARLRVARKNKLLAAFAVGSLKVPNVFLLLDELRDRGLAAADARPWRAVVSVAGFQVPKR